jgi:flagellar hook-basal body complex protein FliE
VAVEKASIAIDLVSAIRNKAVDAYQEVMRMQV